MRLRGLWISAVAASLALGFTGCRSRDTGSQQQQQQQEGIGGAGQQDESGFGDREGLGGAGAEDERASDLPGSLDEDQGEGVGGAGAAGDAGLR